MTPPTEPDGVPHAIVGYVVACAVLCAVSVLSSLALGELHVTVAAIFAAVPIGIIALGGRAARARQNLVR